MKMATRTRFKRSTAALIVGLAAASVITNGTAATAADGTAPGRKVPGAATAEIEVTPDGWIHYPSRHDLVGLKPQKTFKTAGRDSDGNCVVAGEASGEGGASDAITFTEQVAFDPVACESVYASSVLSAAQVRALDATRKTKNKGREQSEDVAKPPKGNITTLGTYGPYAQYVKTFWEDPIQIDISWQQVGLSWNSSAWTHRLYAQDSFKGCVAGACLDKTYVVGTPIRSIAGTGNGWQENAKTHFRNTSFGYWVLAVVGPAGWLACGAPTNSEANFYHDATMRGYAATGGWASSWADSKDGACTNLVHHETEHGSY
jgi:hypothetical protein